MFLHLIAAFFGAGIGAFLATVFADVIADIIADKFEKGKHHIYLRHYRDLEITMDMELKAKIKAKLNVTVQAVQGMMQPDVDEEEKQGWIAIYNGAMRKIMNDYLADEIPQAAPSEEPSAEAGEVAVDAVDIPEDVGGITNAPEGA